MYGGMCLLMYDITVIMSGKITVLIRSITTINKGNQLRNCTMEWKECFLI
jgi:hypothetical protein